MNAVAARRFEPTAWMLAPLLVVMVIGFNVPLIGMLAKSFIHGGSLDVGGYRAMVQSSVYLKVLANTFKIAALATIICAALGYLLAYWLRGLVAKWQMIGLAAIVIPFWISILVRAYAWIVLLGNAGIVNRGMQGFGWVDSPIPFLYNELGVIIGTINVLLPFLVLPLYAAMVKIDDQLLCAAETLGANHWTVFWRVFFPLSLPALAASSTLVFILALGFYITPAVLGGGRVPMIANMLDLLINQMPNWELASSLSIVLLALTLVLFVFYLKFTGEKAEA